MLDAKTRGWVVVETADLRVRSDAGPERAVEMAAQYQRMHDAIAEHELHCGFDRLTLPLEITLFKQLTEPSFHRTEQTALLGLRAQIVVHTVSKDRSVGYFAHELTHRLLAVCFPSATAWLHEGMASFYETARLHGDSLELGFPPFAFMPRSNWVNRSVDLYEHEVDGEPVWVLPEWMVPGANELRAMSRTEFYDPKIERKLLNYGGAWALVHLLKLGELSLSPQFVAYLNRLHDGKRESAAWAESFGDRDIAGRYRAYLSEDPFSRVRSVQVEEPQGLVARTMSSGDAALMLAQLEDWSDDKAAKRALAYIDFAADKDSTRLDAVLVRGALLAARGDEAGAERTFEAALALDASNPDTLAAVLHFHMEQATMDRRAAAEHRAQYEALLRAAVRPYHFAVAAWWTTYIIADTPRGLALAERAIELDGTSFMAYATIGDAAASLGRFEQALGAYRAALALSRGRADRARIELEARIDAIQGKPKASKPIFDWD